MSETESAPARVFEKRWWLWCIAIATLIAIYDFRSRLSEKWSLVSQAEAIAALVGLIVVSVLWRGKIVQGFLLISAGLCVFTAIRTTFGH
ncbi:hypothetical protein [Frondihabitans sp. VKM Ac-2883]|uniref:hypothetical protein n=1 Tax=Frondihabitans sp. VKM Ac-2883 TaxID=2783823 RepID=UPI00188CE8E7|nr:hypothetical protein [Frondihabitans sp. VKM Ac-2883]MBF4576906.1 hypothetical protein [Frondihabitans sp. VKM Ac-2883]